MTSVGRWAAGSVGGQAGWAGRGEDERRGREEERKSGREEGKRTRKGGEEGEDGRMRGREEERRKRGGREERRKGREDEKKKGSGGEKKKKGSEEERVHYRTDGAHLPRSVCLRPHLTRAHSDPRNWLEPKITMRGFLLGICCWPNWHTPAVAWPQRPTHASPLA